jgi:hypothetical protein
MRFKITILGMNGGGQAVMFDSSIGQSTLGQGSFGVNPGQYGFDVVAAVPIPAAAWLFGSAMLGLVGLARGKKA